MNQKALYYFVIALSLIGCAPTVSDVYIAANKEEFSNGELVYSSIGEGINAVAQLRKEGIKNTLTLHIMKGEHRINTPIRITPELGPLSLEGEGTDKSVIKGSKVLNPKWEKYNDHIWVAQLQKEDNFDQLFIDGNKQILARYPNYDENGGHWQGHAADAIALERVETWSNPKGAIVHAMHSGEWGGFHYFATGVDENGELILSGGYQNNRPSKMHAKYRMVENVFEELDAAGEWYLDKDYKLYYWPTLGTDITNVLVEGVQQKHLLEVVGSEEDPVRDINISGIRFEHAKRTFIEDYEPLLRSDWTIYRGAALFMEGAQKVNIQNCEFTNLGGNAILVSNFNREVRIVDNHIHECGASGISFVGSPEAVRSPSFQYDEFIPLVELDTVLGPKSNKYPSNSVAENNLIYRIGRVEKQTAGVQIAMAMDITVSHNSIYDVPRAGINIGDGTWGGHIIEYNDVFNTVLESGDHGAFNSWGRDRFWHPNRETLNEMVAANPEMPKWDAIHTTVIRNNRFRCDHGWDIDLDDGSSNYHIYNNLCLNGGIKLREGFYRTVENNIMINNGFHPHVWFKNSGDVFKHNIVFTEHKDIRLQEWGKEVDYNLFPDAETLLQTQNKGVDENSIFGDALFVDAKLGNYTVKEESAAHKVGFKNFDMDSFGVTNSGLKSLAKSPTIPTMFFGNNNEKDVEFDWLGSKIKSIATMAERSASGLNKTAGVLLLSIEPQTVIGNSPLQVGDVIISAEGDEINTVADLMKSYQNNNWKGKLNLTIFRNQKEKEVSFTTKK
ncbi:PDZ domain-containing protein [Arenibacter sp. F20364]|uniref:PDZ domain-containing protein n=1 Tax=Arenibacter sp. F20364 TaxID=2926415 RepID=UPI001FF36A0A|nr:PDZ domain-containing protein [Arenibacter sp. F20364]MCK0190908.1 PDZ domain-containing protein [Arenibacter sp. F20364]